MKFVPTPQQVGIIKLAAARESVPPVPASMVLLEPGIRVNTETDRGFHMNIAMVSDDPEWNDTDLHDYGQWADFRKGVELTEDGRGIIDMYIRRRFDPDSELCGNVTVYIENGEMVRVGGYGGEEARAGGVPGL